MKCDELERHTLDVWEDMSMYEPLVKASDVDEAIAELKEFAEDACIERDDNQTAIDELQAENAELKAKLENVQASMYADVVDANMENRRLKRALWLARAERARTEQCYENYSFYIHRHQKTMYGGTYRPYIAWLEKWNEVERKCREKAEEYK